MIGLIVLLVLSISASVVFFLCYYNDLRCTISSRVSINSEELPAGATGFRGQFKQRNEQDFCFSQCRDFRGAFPFVLAGMAIMGLIFFWLGFSTSTEQKLRDTYKMAGAIMLSGLLMGLVAYSIPMMFKSIMAG
ncbi:MAG: hypothetical protein V1909_05200 [Candidatus Micrarchaeota archaeon]